MLAIDMPLAVFDTSPGAEDHPMQREIGKNAMHPLGGKAVRKCGLFLNLHYF
jgi:hypothetical protein